MSNYSVIVIDPQKGFCSNQGSLAKCYGEHEIVEIQKTIPRISRALETSVRRYLVKSEYYRGQFTAENLSHPLANLCVPNLNNDSEIIDEFNRTSFENQFIKNQQSAITASKFKKQIDIDLSQGIKEFIVTGFLLDHCVKLTALDLKEYISGNDISVVVCSDLAASRVKKYHNRTVDRTIEVLISSGVRVCSWEDFTVG